MAGAVREFRDAVAARCDWRHRYASLPSERGRARSTAGVRDKLFTLHQLAMAVVNEGSRSKVDELFDFAMELEDKVFEMMEALTRLQDTLTKLTDLRPATSA